MGNQIFRKARVAGQIGDASMDDVLGSSDRTDVDVICLDWGNEESVDHRSAMNCLHNYALGKMECESRKRKPSSKIHHCVAKADAESRKSLRFSENLEQTIGFDSALSWTSTCSPSPSSERSNFSEDELFFSSDS
jgi:hypothetical protein